MRVKIYIADDHQMFREGLRSLLNENDDFEIIGEAGDGNSAIKDCIKTVPDVVILDISMPIMNGLEATKELKEKIPDIKIIILSMHLEKHFITRALNAGINGYVIKNAAFNEIHQAIREVINNNIYLSSQVTTTLVKDYLYKTEEKRTGYNSTLLNTKEKHIVQLIAEGNRTKEIAQIMSLSNKTVESYKTKIMKKLNLNNVALLTKYAIRTGLTTVDF